MERQQRNNLAAFNLLAKKDDAVSQLREYLNTSDKRNTLLHINDLKYGQPTDSDLKTMTARLKLLQTDFNDLSIPKPFSNSSEEMDSELKFIRMLRKLSEDPNTVRDIDDEDKDLISPFMRFAKVHNLPVDETFLRLLVDDVNTLTMRFKYMFNRPRPKQLAAQKGLELIAHEGESANSPSYPSAHSAAGRVLGKALGDKYPDYAAEFDKIGASIGLHRLIAGLHYPTDHAAGMMLGDQIYQKGLVRDHTNFMMPESEALVRAVQQAITKHAEGFNLNKSIDDMRVLVDIFKAEGDDWDWSDMAEDPAPKSERKHIDSVPIDPRAVTIHSGGAKGADSEFAKHTASNLVAGMTKAWSFAGHTVRGGTSAEIPNILKDAESGDILRKTARTLGRPYPSRKEENNDPDFVEKLLRRNWYQVRDSHAVIASARKFVKNNPDKVDGGTGWAVQMGIDEGIPVHVFIEDTNKWYTWDNDANGQRWDEVDIDDIPFYQDFAGVGSREIGDVGKQAIEDYCKRLGEFQKTDKEFTPLNDDVRIKREPRIDTAQKLASLGQSYAEDVAKEREARKARQQDPNNINAQAEGHEHARFFRDLANSYNDRGVEIRGTRYRNAEEAYNKLQEKGYMGYTGIPKSGEPWADPLHRRYGGGDVSDTTLNRDAFLFPIEGTQTFTDKLINDFNLMVDILTSKLEQHGDLVDSLQAIATSQVDDEGNAAPMEVLDYIRSLNHQTGSNNDYKWTGDKTNSNFIRALHNAYINVTNNDLEIPDQVQEITYAEDDPHKITPKVKDLVDNLSIPQTTWNAMSDGAKLQALKRAKHLPVYDGMLRQGLDKSTSALRYPSERAIREGKETGVMTGVSPTGERIVMYDTKPFERHDPQSGGMSYSDIVQDLVPRIASTIYGSSTQPTHILAVGENGYNALIGRKAYEDTALPIGTSPRPNPGDWTAKTEITGGLFNAYGGKVRETDEYPRGGYLDGSKITTDDIRKNPSRTGLIKVIKLPEAEQVRALLGLKGGGVPNFEGQEPSEELTGVPPLNAHYIQEFVRRFPYKVQYAYLSDMEIGGDISGNQLEVRGRMANTPHEKLWGSKAGGYRDGILTQLVEAAQRLDKYGTSTLSDMFDDVLESIHTELREPHSHEVMSRLQNVVGSFHNTLWPPRARGQGAAMPSLDVGSRKGSDENLSVADVIRDAMRTEEWEDYAEAVETERKATAAEVLDKFRQDFSYELDRMHPNQRKLFDETASGEYGERALKEHFLRASLRGAYKPTVYNPDGTVRLEAKLAPSGPVAEMAPWVQERKNQLEAELKEKFNSVTEFPDNKRPTEPEKPKMNIEDAEGLEPQQLEELKQQWADYNKALAEYPAKLKRYNNPKRKKINDVLNKLNSEFLLNEDFWGEQNNNKNLQLYTDLFLEPIPTGRDGVPLSGALYNRYKRVFNSVKNNTYFRQKKPAPVDVTHKDLQTFLKVLGITGGESMFPSAESTSIDATNKYGAPVTVKKLPSIEEGEDGDAIIRIEGGLIGGETNKLNARTAAWLNKPENAHYRNMMAKLGNAFDKRVEARIQELYDTVDITEIEDENGMIKERVLREIDEEVRSHFMSQAPLIVQRYDPDGDVLASDPKLEAFKKNLINSAETDTTTTGQKFPQSDRASYLPNTPRPSDIRQEYAAWHKDNVLQNTALKVTTTGKNADGTERTPLDAKGFGELSPLDQARLTEAYYRDLEGREEGLSLDDEMFDKYYRSNYGKSARQAAKEWDDFDNGVRSFRYTTTKKDGTVEVTDTIPEATEALTFEGKLGYAPETAAQRKRDRDYDAQMDSLFETELPDITQRQRDQIEATFGRKGGLDDQYFGTADPHSALTNSSDAERLAGYFKGVRKVLRAVANGEIMLANENLEESPELSMFATDVVQSEVDNIIDTETAPPHPNTIKREDYTDMSDEDFEDMRDSAQKEYAAYHADLPDPVDQPIDYVPPQGKKGHRMIGAEAGTDQERRLVTDQQQALLRQRSNVPLKEQTNAWLPATDFPSQARSVREARDGKSEDGDMPRPNVRTWYSGESRPKRSLLTEEQKKALFANRIASNKAQEEAIAEYNANLSSKEEEPEEDTTSSVHPLWGAPTKIQFTGAGGYRTQRGRGMTDEEIEAQARTPEAIETENIVEDQKDLEAATKDTQQEPTIDPDLDARLATVTSPSPQEVKTAQEGAGAEYAARVARGVGEGIEDANK